MTGEDITTCFPFSISHPMQGFRCVIALIIADTLGVRA